jgi:1-acyl-sn-glycerol-3-phosphate acyltransferase
MNASRRLMRKMLSWLSRVLVRLFTDVTVTGRDNIPARGPLLVVSNHLGDADGIIGLGLTPVPVEIVAKIELHSLPIFGALLQAYGVIWIHRGQADRRAIRVVLEALAEGRIVAVAPEGRESLTGGLEEGTAGAAYLAYRAKAPILPVTFTGTRNTEVYANLKRLRRTRITVTIGPVFTLQDKEDWHTSVEHGTQLIMQTLASQLPLEYQGVFKIESPPDR